MEGTTMGVNVGVIVGARVGIGFSQPLKKK